MGTGGLWVRCGRVVLGMYKGTDEPSPYSTGSCHALTEISAWTQRECPGFERNLGQLESLEYPQNTSLLCPIALCILASFRPNAGRAPLIEGGGKAPILHLSRLATSTKTPFSYHFLSIKPRTCEPACVHGRTRA